MHTTADKTSSRAAKHDANGKSKSSKSKIRRKRTPDMALVVPKTIEIGTRSKSAPRRRVAELLASADPNARSSSRGASGSLRMPRRHTDTADGSSKKLAGKEFVFDLEEQDDDDDDLSSLGEPSAILDAPAAGRGTGRARPSAKVASASMATANSRRASLRAKNADTATSPRTSPVSPSDLAASWLQPSSSSPQGAARGDDDDTSDVYQRNRRLVSALRATRKMAENALAQVRRLQDRNAALTTELEERRLEVSELTERLQAGEDRAERRRRAQRRQSLCDSLDSFRTLGDTVDAPPLPPPAPAAAAAAEAGVPPQLLSDLRDDLLEMERRLEAEQKRRVEFATAESELRNRIIQLEGENLRLRKERRAARKKEETATKANNPTPNSHMSRPRSLSDITKSLASQSMKNLVQGLKMEEEVASCATLPTAKLSSRSNSNESSSPTDFEPQPGKGDVAAAQVAKEDQSADAGSENRPVCIEDANLVPTADDVGQEWTGALGEEFTARLNDDEEVSSATGADHRHRDSEKSQCGNSTGRPPSSLESIMEDFVFDEDGDDDDIDIDAVLNHRTEEMEGQTARDRLRKKYFQDECQISVQSLPARIANTTGTATHVTKASNNGTKSNTGRGRSLSFSSSIRYEQDKGGAMRRRWGSFGSFGRISPGGGDEATEPRTKSSSQLNHSHNHLPKHNSAW
jgi:hypothetical protein